MLAKQRQLRRQARRDRPDSWPELASFRLHPAWPGRAHRHRRHGPICPAVLSRMVPPARAAPLTAVHPDVAKPFLAATAGFKPGSCGRATCRRARWRTAAVIRHMLQRSSRHDLDRSLGLAIVAGQVRAGRSGVRGLDVGLAVVRCERRRIEIAPGEGLRLVGVERGLQRAGDLHRGPRGERQVFLGDGK